MFSKPKFAIGLILALFLLFLSTRVANAADYYVRTDGHDTNCIGTANFSDASTETTACAFLTIQKAADTVANGDTVWVADGTYAEQHDATNKFLNLDMARNFTIRSASGNRGDVTITDNSHANYAVRFYNSDATKVVTFQDVTITSDTAVSGTIALGYSNGFTCNNCVISNTAGGPAIYYYQNFAGKPVTLTNGSTVSSTNTALGTIYWAAAGGNLTITGGTIVSGAATASQIIYNASPAAPTAPVNITITGSTVQSTAAGTTKYVYKTGNTSSLASLTIDGGSQILNDNGPQILLDGDVGTVLIDDSTFGRNGSTASTDNYAVKAIATTLTIDSLTITNSTFTTAGIINLNRPTTATTIQNNTHTPTAGSSERSIQLGENEGSDHTSAIDDAVVSGNTITFPSDYHAHGILLGANANSALVEKNYIENADYAIPVKSTGSTIRYNVIKNSTIAGITTMAATSTSILYNSITSSSGDGVRLFQQHPFDPPDSNSDDITLKYNSIEDSNLSGYAIFTGNSTTSNTDPLVDYNVYWNSGAGDVARLQTLVKSLTANDLVWNNSANGTLTKAGLCDGYTFSSGDQFHANAGTGITAGEYNIVSCSGNVLTLSGNSLKSSGTASDVGGYIITHTDYSSSSLSDWQSHWDTDFPGTPSALSDENSVFTDPKFTADLHFSYLSPAIDAGIDIGLTTDFSGNPIYGLPDIGAYEYQPPYTMGTHLLSTDGDVVTRVYGDEKFRVKSATSTPDAADLDVAIAGVDKTDWLDVEITSWENSGTYQKTWTASSTIADVDTTFTVGDLEADAYYTISLDGATSTDIVAAGTTVCNLGVCQADGAGQLAFSYSAGYSTHTFDVVEDTTAPTVSLTAPASLATVAGDNVSLTATASDAGGVAGVEFKLDSDTLIEDDTNSPYAVTWDASAVSDGSHTLSAVARDNTGNYATSTVTVTVDNTGPVRSAGSPSSTLVAGTVSTTLTLTTDETATCKYGPTANTAYATIANPFTTTGTTAHSQTLTGLTNGITYTYYVRCTDSLTNTNTADYTISFSVATLLSPSSGVSVRPPVVLAPPPASRSLSEAGFTPAQLSLLRSLLTPSRQTPLPPAAGLHGPRFTQPPRLGQANQNVKQLQRFLNNHGFSIALTGPGSPGQETTYFGQLTRQALGRFQVAKGLISSTQDPAFGYLGPKTRAVINGLE